MSAAPGSWTVVVKTEKKEPKGPDKGSEQGAGLGRPGWDMDTVGWDAKGDWGCSRAAEKDKKAPAAPPAFFFGLSSPCQPDASWGVWCRYTFTTR